MCEVTLVFLLEKLFLLGMQAQSHKMYQSEGMGFGVDFSRLEYAIDKNTNEKNKVITQILNEKKNDELNERR